MAMAVRLRPIDAGDSVILFSWCNLPEVARYMYRDHEITEDEHDQWFEDGGIRFMVELDGKAVGFAHVTKHDAHNRRCSWGHYIADPSVRGRGIGKAIEYLITDHCFSVLGVHKIEIEVFAWNLPALNLHHKFGYHTEGRFIDHIWKDGRFHDATALGMTSEEWAALKPLRASYCDSGEKVCCTCHRPLPSNDPADPRMYEEFYCRCSKAA